tara:strand:+ start:407 stop:1006 length:600 start_codon:yes stop_codon:yes gene_type:complete
MASKLIVNEIEHTDGSGTAVTLAKATIADATLTSATLTSATLTAGTLGSGVTFPAGHVIQCISKSDGTMIANTTTGADVSLLSHVITGVLATSKVLITITGFIGKSNMNGGLQLKRDGTSLLEQTVSGRTGFFIEDDSSVASDHSMQSFVWSHLDDNPTTGTNTYLLATKATTTFYWNRCTNNENSRAYSTITLMEIAQ